jgi:hypothetical protein
MITLKDFCEAVEYKFTGGSNFQWRCFGENARYLDCGDVDGYGGKYSVNAVFDSTNQTVYQMEVWDYENNREYRWTHPDYVKAYKKESKKRDVNPKESLDGRTYIELEVAEDILEKANALVNGLEYDTRVQVPIDLDQETMYTMFCEAHKRDLTLNQFVEQLLVSVIEERKHSEN